jgi:addiction module HigA family antidote
MFIPGQLPARLTWQRPLADDFHFVERFDTMTKTLAPLHPGEVLREDFLIPLGISAGTLAKACRVPRTRIERLASEEIGITADTALRLSKALGTTATLWLTLQNDLDIRIAKREIGKELDKISPVVEKFSRGK